MSGFAKYGVKGFANAWCIGMVVSTGFPVVTSALVVDSVPRWVGVADVSLAAGLLAGAAWLSKATRPFAMTATTNDQAYALNKTLLQVPLALLAMFFLIGKHLNWTVLLCGLAWRAWLVSAIARQLVTALHSQRKQSIVAGGPTPGQPGGA
jgi:hypothetical protein